MIPWHLLAQHLRRAWFRTFLTAAGIALAIFLMTTLRTVVTTLEETVKAAGGNRVIVSSAVSLFRYLPAKIERELRSMPGVRDVAHWTWFGGVYIDEGNMFGRFATEPTSFRRVYGDLSKGREDIVLPVKQWEDFIDDKTGCVVGAALAKQYGFAIGDTIELRGNIFPGNYAFNVKGIYERGSSQMDEVTLFFHWSYLDEVNARRGDVSLFTLDLEPGTDLAEIAIQVDERFASSDSRTRTMTEAAFNQMFISMWGNVPLFLSMIGGAVLFAAFMIALNTMLLHGQERRLEVGVLKALGFPNNVVGTLFVAEGILVCGLGGDCQNKVL